MQPRHEQVEPPGASDNGRDEAPPSEAFRAAMSQVGELKDYASQYVGAKLDGIKLSIKSAVLWAVFGIVALIAGSAIIVTSASLVVIGLAQAVSTMFGRGPWLGNLIIGLVLLLGVMLAAMMLIKRLINSSRNPTVERYERSLQRQRVEHGHDARQRSQEYAESH